MNAGETERFECQWCNREYDITLEPKAVGLPEDEKPTDSATVDFCPFCAEALGKEDLQDDE